MGIIVKLMHNSSPVEKIGKSLDAGTDFTCDLKADTSVLKPTLVLQSASSLAGFNYMYIPDFQRYYFIDDIVSKNNVIWEVSGHVDVLQTYKTDILKQSAVISRQQNKYNLYLNDVDFRTYNNDLIQTKSFSPGGFSKTLTYLLVVNGS